MGMWKRITKLQKEITRTPGPIRVQLLLLTTLTLSSVTSTGLLIYKTVDNTSEESISTRNENLKEASDVLRQSLTGSGITEALQNLNQTLNNLEKKYSEEKL